MSSIHKFINRQFVRPANKKRGKIVQIIQSPQPSVGVVIGTYAALPYIHLQLEARRRFWSDIPTLVHDDCSSIQDELREMCERYGAEFVATSARLGHYRGDIQVFVAGLEWAQNNNLELLVKTSRRYLIHKPWVDDLQALALTTQYATYGNRCIDAFFPMRSECMAMHTDLWHQSEVAETLRNQVENYDDSLIKRPLEHWYYKLARKVHQAMPVTRGTISDQTVPTGAVWDGSDWGGYGIWPLLGDGGNCHVPGVMWRRTHSPADYLNLALEWGISDYEEFDFSDPRLGQNDVDKKSKRN